MTKEHITFSCSLHPGDQLTLEAIADSRAIPTTTIPQGKYGLLVGLNSGLPVLLRPDQLVRLRDWLNQLIEHNQL